MPTRTCISYRRGTGYRQPIYSRKKATRSVFATQPITGSCFTMFHSREQPRYVNVITVSIQTCRSLGRISHEATLVYCAVYTHVSGMFHGCFCPVVHTLCNAHSYCNVSGMFQRCSLPVLHCVAIYTIHHVSLMFTVMNYVMNYFLNSITIL